MITRILSTERLLNSVNGNPRWRLTLGDGIVCDATCAAGPPGIVAAGDCARWYNPLFGEHMRVEHWTNAVEQARHVVQTLCRPEEAKPFESAPMFWSDQYDIKIQGAGRPKPTDELRIMGRLDDETFVALYSREDRLVGAVSFNNPAKLIQLRRKIVNRASLSEAVELFGGDEHRRGFTGVGDDRGTASRPQTCHDLRSVPFELAERHDVFHHADRPHP